MTMNNTSFFIDESGFHGDSIALLCCVVIQQPDHVRASIDKLKEDILHNMRYAGILHNFEKDGFHYCDNHPEIRQEFLNLLSSLPFEGYINFTAERVSRPHRNDLYDRMFGRILYDRLLRYRGSHVDIYFEQHDSKVARRLEELRLIALRIDHQIKSEHDIQNIGVPHVVSADKDEPCLAIADYLCAIFRKYYEALGNEAKWEKGEPFEKRDFDDLRTKIRVIHDFENNVFYSRHNPLPYVR